MQLEVRVLHSCEQHQSCNQQLEELSAEEQTQMEEAAKNEETQVEPVN